MQRQNKIDYINVTEIQKDTKKTWIKKNRIIIKEKMITGINCLWVEICGKKTERQIINRIKKELKKYETDLCVFGTDAETAARLQLEEEWFLARKKELLDNSTMIFRQMRKLEKNKNRATMLLVPDSGKWNWQEIFSLLKDAKNFFEDIYIVQDGENEMINRIRDMLYDEWGIVLHGLTRREAVSMQPDFVLFLMESWSPVKINRYQFKNAYVLAESELGLKRSELEMLSEQSDNSLHLTEQYLYYGLAYKKEKEWLPYDMVVNIAYQNSELYQKIQVSAVAIYRLKWYNRENVIVSEKEMDTDIQ